MILACEIFAIWSCIGMAIALKLGQFVQKNRPADWHEEWARSGDSA